MRASLHRSAAPALLQTIIILYIRKGAHFNKTKKRDHGGHVFLSVFFETKTESSQSRN